MKRIAYVSGTRADYGLMRNVLREIQNHSDLELDIFAVGMHVMPEFGSTYKEIVADGFNVKRLECRYASDSKSAMSAFLGLCILKLTEQLKDRKYDRILVLGDRAEMLAAATVGTYLSLPIIHIHGGDISSTVDEHVRHAITKLAHIHCAATEKSAERIRKMGEDPNRIYTVGAPGVEAILQEQTRSREEICKEYGLDATRPYSVLIQHPVTAEMDESGNQARETLEAINCLELQTVVIYPSADAGGRKIIDIIEENTNKLIKAYKNIPRSDFISLVSSADVLIGNSSTGVIESAAFRVPAVNIGTRQEGREKAKNVIDCGYDAEEIRTAITQALSDEFRSKVESVANPYYKPDTAKQIAKIIADVDISNVQKTITY